MALPSTGDIVHRTDGSDDNGGGWNSARGGTRYNDRSTPILSITDGATASAGSTTLTTAAAGLTDAMKGSYGKVTAGTNIEQDIHFEIVSVTNSSTCIIDRAIDDGVGGVSGATIQIGGAKANPKDEHYDDATKFCVVEYNTVYFKKGTYSGLSAIMTNLDNFYWEGFNTTPGDSPSEADQPTIDSGSNNMIFDEGNHFRFLKFTTTSANGWRVDRGGCFYRCKGENTSGSSNRPAFRGNDQGVTFISCEGISTNGPAFQGNGNGTRFLECYARDSSIGFDLAKLGSIAESTVADNCTTGYLVQDPYVTLKQFVAYGCTTGVEVGAETQFHATNGIVSNNTTGVAADSVDDDSYVDFLVLHSNTTDLDNITDHGNNQTGDPNFTDPANEDFTIDASSSAVGSGASIEGASGIVGAYPRNCGIDWDDHVSGGGGGSFIHVGMDGGMNG